MSAINRSQAGGEPLIIRAEIDPQTSKVSFGGSSFAANALKESGEVFKKAQYEWHIFSPDTIVLTLCDASSKELITACLNVKEVAAFLGVNQRRVKDYVNEGNLEGYISAQCRANNAERAPNKALPELVMQETIPTLSNYGFSEHEYIQICRWYTEHKDNLESEGVSVHLKPDVTHLPRTVIYIAEGPHKGLHIRSKVTVGIGGFNKASRALHVDSGKTKVARSAFAFYVSQAEIDSNEDYAKIDPDGTYFATGAPVKHKGSLRNRREIRKTVGKFYTPLDISKQTWAIHQDKNIDKVTFIMDEIPDGELSKIIYGSFENRTHAPSEYMQILIHLNEGLILAHRQNKVDIDYKPANVFMQGNVPKMGDFGMVYSVGSILNRRRGTPGFISPEVVDAGNNPVTIQPGNQMWIQGCIMAMMFKGFDFDNWTDQRGGNYGRVCNEQSLRATVKHFFPEYNTKGSIDWCIAQCLQYKPEERISAENLHPYLESIQRELLAKEAEQLAAKMVSVAEQLQETFKTNERVTTEQLEAQLDDRDKEMLEKAEQAAAEMVNLINQIEQLELLDTGSSSIHESNPALHGKKLPELPANQSLQVLAEHVTEQLSSELNSKKIEAARADRSSP